MDFISTTRNDGRALAHVPDAVFHQPGGSLSIVCDRPSAHRLISHYNYRITLTPRSLIDHVRLILLLREHGGEGELAAALHRLFDVLGAAGRDLRVSLLAQCMSALDDDVITVLKHRIDSHEVNHRRTMQFIEHSG